MKTILVIEDDPFIRESICDVLELEGYGMLAAPNGMLGIKLALDHSPDLIVCDISMPELDGYAVLGKLQQEQKTSAIPFIFLTARTTQADLRRGMNLGADDYLAKPCTANELINAIASRFEKQSILKNKAEKQMKSLRDNISQSLPHELYTPLNGILGFSEILFQDYETIEPSEMREIGEAIHTSALRLHHLMQNFLLYTKLELIAHHPEQAESLKTHRIHEPNWVIQNTAQVTAAQVNRSEDLQFQLCAPADGQPKILLNLAESYLHKVVRELIDNALKFSEPATPIQVSSELQLNCLLFSVTNQGRGMTTEQMSNLGAYMQFDRKHYEQQGAGMGLIIVKRITELFGGKFQISSVPDLSTTVQVGFEAAFEE